MALFRNRGESSRPQPRQDAAASPGPRNIDEFYALFRSSWPDLPEPWIRTQQQRWGPMLQAVAEGSTKPWEAAVKPGDDLETLLSNLTGVWFMAGLPGDWTVTSQRFIDVVIKGLGPNAEILRSDFLSQAAAMVRNAES